MINNKKNIVQAILLLISLVLITIPFSLPMDYTSRWFLFSYLKIFAISLLATLLSWIQYEHGKKISLLFFILNVLAFLFLSTLTIFAILFFAGIMEYNR